jgi:chaperonin GroES
MNIKLLYDRIAVERIEALSKTAGGIIIPETSKEKPSEGIVVAVGSGNRSKSGEIIPLDVKVGDRVIFTKWDGSEETIDGKDIVIMKETNVKAIRTN